MSTKSPLAVQNDLARFLGATIKCVEKEFKYLLPGRKPALVKPSEKLFVARKEIVVEPLVVKPAPAVVAAPAPVVVLTPAPVAMPKVVVMEVPVVRAAAPAALPEKIVAAPVREKKFVSREAGLKGIEFANKSEELEAEIYFRDLQSSSRTTRMQALREIKKLSRSTAAVMLEQLLPAQQDTLQIIEILNALASICEEASTPKDIFKEYAGHKDAGVRLAALRAISKYHDDESFDILSSCMKDKDAEVRRQMLNCLCWTFSERCLPFAVNGLHDIDSGVRKAASQIVGALRSNQAISGLITLLSDPDADVQATAAASLKKITREDFGFKANSPKKAKDDAIECWRFWWRDNQTKFNRSRS